MSRGPISNAEPDTATDGVPHAVAGAALPVMCTLTGADQTERVRRWRELLAQARCRQTIDRGLRCELPTALVAEVAELAAAE